jgi:predicted nucleic acid-binding protein
MTKKLIFDKQSLEQFRNGYILVDNTALIDASSERDSAMYSFLSYLNEINCDLVTTQSVYQEFVRGAKDIAQNNIFMSLMKELGIEAVVNTEKQFWAKENVQFRIAYCQEAKNASLTDAGLAIYAYAHKKQNVGILTSNYRDMPESLFRRASFFSYEYNRDIRTHAVYLIRSDEVLTRTMMKYSNQG